MPLPYLSKSSSLHTTSTSTSTSSSSSSFPRSESRASGIFGPTLTTILVGPSETATEFKISKNILYNESELLRSRLVPPPSHPQTSSTSFSTPLSNTPDPTAALNTIHLPSVNPASFSALNYWFYTQTIPISAAASASHADVLSRLQLFSLAEFLGIASLEERLYADLRWLSYYSLLRPSFPSAECLAFVFSLPSTSGSTDATGIKNAQLRRLLVRCFAFAFLRQAWTGDVGAIRDIAARELDFRSLLTEEMGCFSGARRGHPFFDQDLEIFEGKRGMGRVLLKQYGQLREGKTGVVEIEVGGDGLPVRKSKRGAGKRVSGLGMADMGSRLGPGAVARARQRVVVSL